MGPCGSARRSRSVLSGSTLVPYHVSTDLGLVRSSGETAHQLVHHRHASFHSSESMQRCVLPVQPTVAHSLGVSVGARREDEGARDASRRGLCLKCPALLLRRHRPES